MKWRGVLVKWRGYVRLSGGVMFSKVEGVRWWSGGGMFKIEGVRLVEWEGYI
jgi:hypothetical protein